MKRIAALIALLALFFNGAAQAATLLPNAEQCFYDSNGDPLSSGTVGMYIPATTTFKNTWQDSGGSVLNTNPITLDASGCAIIYGTGEYRQILKDSAGTTIWDQLTNDTAPATGLSWGGTSGGTADAQTVTTTGFSSTAGDKILFLAGATNTGAATLNPDATGALTINKASPNGLVALEAGDITAGNLVEVDYDGSILHLINPSGANLNPDVVNLGSVITDALTGNTNDWNPTGLSAANTIRVTANGNYTISGLTAPSTDGRMIVVENVDNGTDTLTLLPNNSGSAAANRFDFRVPVVLAPSQSVTLLYDDTDDLWRNASPVVAQPVASGSRALTVTATGATTVTVTADAMTLEDAQGTAYRATSVSTTCTITTSGANGLDTGSETADTWYSIWTIFAPSTNTVACLMSTSETDPTLPSGYTFERRNGWVRNDSSSDLFRTIQRAHCAQYVVGTNPTATRIVDSGASSSTWDATDIVAGGFVPGTAYQVNVSVRQQDTTVNDNVGVAANGNYTATAAPATNAPPTLVGNSNGTDSDTKLVQNATVMLESDNLYYHSDGASGVLFLYGWCDDL